MKLYGFEEELLLKLIHRDEGLSEGEIIESEYDRIENEYENDDIFVFNGRTYPSEKKYYLQVMSEAITSLIEGGFLKYSHTNQFGGEDVYMINDEYHVLILTSYGENYEELLKASSKVVNNFNGDKLMYFNADNSSNINVQNNTNSTNNSIKFNKEIDSTNILKSNEQSKALKSSHWVKLSWLYGAIATGVVTLILTNLI
jgi:hypothetical protein